ncbi:MAG: bifunctional proline dehydrogenase/L-glutamate gamma-semialdehyde dehydrogenase PutA [Wolbachia endosymbiont of Fragariocoptes setiger]|nr:bifunctional proline dehydrogenase/L-glutamate gamma-semialdehyde dehydrogenase PutA [Wolbachia endosymbiont of Fragariocoptes setiger]
MLEEPNALRKRLHSLYRADEKSCIRYLAEKAELSTDSKNRIYNIAKQVIEKIRYNKLDVIDSFLNQYSLSNDEGIALMCLAESVLRIPDEHTIDELIKDKITNKEWNKYRGNSSSLFVNASTWSLMLGSSILKDSKEESKLSYAVSRLLKNLGEPVIRKLIKQAMSMLGKQFIIGETIEEALKYSMSNENDKSLYSFDMLGEDVNTADHAEECFNSYMYSIKAIGETNDCLKSHGISIKLSSLHPRYEFSQFDYIKKKILSKLIELCLEAKKYNISLYIDAEESEKLEMSLLLFEKLRLDESLSQWEGLGLTVQAYQKRALCVLDFIEDIAIRSKHKVIVRLVKGAYWDSEIKRTQELGLKDYPVFTRKSYTDISYLACAQKLLSKINHFYPCFATHNAYTFATIVEIANKSHPGFEFQRLYGMGKDLYDYAMSDLTTGITCRIYAPIGKHSNLLQYLVRRLFENGACNSFIHQINDTNIQIDGLILDPFEQARSSDYEPHSSIPLPQDIFKPQRKNSLGIDINDSVTFSHLTNSIKNLSDKKWQVGPIINGQLSFDDNNYNQVINPACFTHVIGTISYTTDIQALNALEIAHEAFFQWRMITAAERAQFLEKAADIIEDKAQMLIYILIAEAGKVFSDAIAEVRKAVDLLRYYAAVAKNDLFSYKSLPGPTGEDNFIFFESRGVFLCISPCNSPMAVFIGQISAAVVTGNTVLAKPARQTPIIAYETIRIMHEAGIPENVLHFIPGNGEYLGKVLIPDNKVAGIAFTGSKKTAQMINRVLAERNGPIIPFISEIGGLNVMIVDSSALLEQVTKDILSSAFGYSYSSLKLLYIQEDIAEDLINMISGAVQELRIGNPMELSTDIGPIIDQGYMNILNQYVEEISEDKDINLLSKAPINTDPHNSYFFPPCIYEIQKISQLNQEVFGPILHIIRFNKSKLHEIIDDINNTGYGLTLSLQSRIHGQISLITKKVLVGNVYINRNQVVGMQPFGGRGTSPKSCGPNYLQCFCTEKVTSTNTTAFGGNTELACLN